MIISHRHKFAFFRPPKTGTTTAMFFLRICGAFDDSDTLSGMPTHGLKQSIDLPYAEHDWVIVENAHATPEKAIELGLITIEQLREYRTLAFIRDPYRRTLSAFIHAVGRFCDPSYIKHHIEKHSPTEPDGLLTRGQSAWFYVDGELVVQPMLMDNYENNLREMIRYVDGIEFPVIPSMNARHRARDAYPIDEWISPEFIDHVKTRYAQDIELYNNCKARK